MFLPILGTLLVQVFSFWKGTYNLQNLYRSVHIKVRWKMFQSLLPPSIFSLSLNPKQNLKEALNVPLGMHCTIHLLEIMRLSFNLQVRSILSILLVENGKERGGKGGGEGGKWNLFMNLLKWSMEMQSSENSISPPALIFRTQKKTLPVLQHTMYTKSLLAWIWTMGQ
jgi:hypothetical protein